MRHPEYLNANLPIPAPILKELESLRKLAGGQSLVGEINETRVKDLKQRADKHLVAAIQQFAAHEATQSDAVIAQCECAIHLSDERSVRFPAYELIARSYSRQASLRITTNKEADKLLRMARDSLAEIPDGEYFNALRTAITPTMANALSQLRQQAGTQNVFKELAAAEKTNRKQRGDLSLAEGLSKLKNVAPNPQSQIWRRRFRSLTASQPWFFLHLS